jgi:hypothetical protein
VIVLFALPVLNSDIRYQNSQCGQQRAARGDEG